MPVFLEPDNGKGLKIAIDKAIVFIGRHPDCDVVITRSSMISRKHCAIAQVNDALVIRDLGSTNGVRVNGKKIQKEARFKAGDSVTIGDLEYLVKSIKEQPPEKRPKREHAQDARAGGATARKPAASAPHDEEEEDLPMAIPVEDDEDSPANRNDTPDAIPVVEDPFLDEQEDRPRGGRKHRPSDGESYIPLAD